MWNKGQERVCVILFLLVKYCIVIELCFNLQQEISIVYSCYLGPMGFYDCSQIKYIEMKKSKSVKLTFKVLLTNQIRDNPVWSI